jgi:protein-S-isoprenylcysteine O-methyltransferase Ste14
MKTFLFGFFTPWIIYAGITILHFVLPGRRLTGYAKHSKTGELLKYRINGLPVLITSIGLWFFVGYLGWVPFDWLYTVRWHSLAGAFTLGLLFSFLIVLPFPSTGKPWLADLFMGRMENPQLPVRQFDVKMWLYLIGAVMLQLNVLSFAAHHYAVSCEISSGVILGAIMLTFFVWDYLTFENVHLYTYDFFAERVGLKLGWGCLTFYPYFYLISLWATVDLQNPDTPGWLLVCFVIVFITGWILSRGANMQKFYFKTQPQRTFLGIKPESISEGKLTLLVNGFWGVSRHINYLGEILMGLAIALSVGYPGIIWVWLYPLYYVMLLFLRQNDDDKRCSSRYGNLWKRYSEKVKYRIIPYLY